jgi:hypothetical protein
MSPRAILSGTLFKAPVSKTSKAGKPSKPKKSKPQDGHQPFETKRWGGPDNAVPF